MKHVLDELRKSLKYHLRQMEDNSNKISHYEEAMHDLKTRNERHKEAIAEIGQHIKALEKD